MYCPQCGTKNADDASFCVQCGNPLAAVQAPQPGIQQVGVPSATPSQASIGELASMGQRAGSFVVDIILQAIPYVNFVIQIINWVKYRRGSTIGLGLAGARIVRENGDLSGFYHTSVRSFASALSMIPLGLGFWWAFWDSRRQTWHDKMLHTYVLRNTPELEGRMGSSSDTAKTIFWVFLVGIVVVIVLVAVVGGG